MFSGGLKRTYTESEKPRWQQHNPTDADGIPLEPEETPESGPTAVNTPNNGAASRSEGTWGERDQGPVNQRQAMQDYETLRQELTTLSKTRSQRQGKEQDGLRRTTTGESARSRRSAHRTQTQASVARTSTVDTEALEHDSSGEDDFELDQFMREGHFEKRTDGHSAKKVGVVYKDL